MSTYLPEHHHADYQSSQADTDAPNLGTPWLSTPESSGLSKNSNEGVSNQRYEANP